MNGSKDPDYIEYRSANLQVRLFNGSDNHLKVARVHKRPEIHQIM